MSRRRNTVLSALEILRGERPEMTLTLCRVFFYVAENPGLSVAELAALCGFTEATASRSVAALGRGAALVEVAPSPIDSRSIAIHLSITGEQLARRIDERIASMVTIDPSYPRTIGRDAEHRMLTLVQTSGSQSTQMENFIA